VKQLALVDVAPSPSLTPRQARALELLTAAGSTGLHADELGALLHEEYKKHGRDERCVYCAMNGQSILKALRAKGLARYRRGTPAMPGFWQATGAERAAVAARGMLRDDQPIPF
jgi:hypothetical protein